MEVPDSWIFLGFATPVHPDAPGERAQLIPRQSRRFRRTGRCNFRGFRAASAIIDRIARSIGTTAGARDDTSMRIGPEPWPYPELRTLI